MARYHEKRLRGMVKALAGAGIVAMLLSGCGSSPEEMVQSARGFLEKNDPKAASIQLKNALQENPGLAEARFLLGRVHLDQGDVPSALKELKRASELGYSADQVTPLLARAMVMGGEGKEMIEQFANTSLGDPASQAQLQATLGEAYLGTGAPDKAEERFRDAARDAGARDRAELGLARVSAGKRDLEGALSQVEGILAHSPKYVDALLFKAALLNAREEPAKAAEAYSAAIAIEPSAVAPHFELVSLLLRDRKFDEAAEKLKAMQAAVGKDNAQAVYLQAYLDFSQGRMKPAQESIERVLRVAPNYLPARLLAGAIYLRTGDILQAQGHLNSVLAVAPRQLVARRLLVGAHLAARETDRAADVLQPLLKDYGDHADVMSLAGQVYLAKGDFARSSEYFAKAVELDPKDASARTRLGISRLASGDSSSAFSDLEAAAEMDEDRIQADVALVMSHLRRGEIDKASEALGRLEKKQPDNPLVSNLLGAVMLGKGDLPKAREAFERAISLKADYLPAVTNLARLDLADKKPEEATKRFERLIEANPKLVDAYVALADLNNAVGRPADEVRKVLDRGLSANPGSLPLKIALVRHELRGGDPKAALTIAEEAQAAAPNDAVVLDVLGRTQLAAARPEQAVATFGKLAGLRPDVPAVLLMLAQAQLATKNASGAELSLKKALALKPDLIEAQRLLMALRAQAKDEAGALALAAEVQKQRPKAATGFLMEGDYLLSQKKFAPAAASYRRAMQLEPSAQAVVKLHAALTAAGKNQDADREAEAWLRKQPKDLTVRGYLAEAQLRKGDYAKAAQVYKGMLTIAPGNALVQNNYAWAAWKAGDPKAMSYAEEALKTAPDSPAILDTVAMIQLESGEGDKAIANLKRAVEKAPKAVPIILNLARAYAKTGKADEARALLGQLERDFPGAAAVKKEIAAIRGTL